MIEKTCVYCGETIYILYSSGGFEDIHSECFMKRKKEQESNQAKLDIVDLLNKDFDGIDTFTLMTEEELENSKSIFIKDPIVGFISSDKYNTLIFDSNGVVHSEKIDMFVELMEALLKIWENYKEND